MCVEESSKTVLPLILLLTHSVRTSREEMRDRMKRLELEKQLEEAVLRIAKQGEPMDPEMLNPARKRPPVKVCRQYYEQLVVIPVVQDFVKHVLFEELANGVISAYYVHHA